MLSQARWVGLWKVAVLKKWLLKMVVQIIFDANCGVKLLIENGAKWLDRVAIFLINHLLAAVMEWRMYRNLQFRAITDSGNWIGERGMWVNRWCRKAVRVLYIIGSIWQGQQGIYSVSKAGQAWQVSESRLTEHRVCTWQSSSESWWVGIMGTVTGQIKWWAENYIKINKKRYGNAYR